MLYLLPFGFRHSYIKHIGRFVLCCTYRHLGFVIPTLHASYIYFFMSYLSQCGCRYSYINLLGGSIVAYIETHLIKPPINTFYTIIEVRPVSLTYFFFVLQSCWSFAIIIVTLWISNAHNSSLRSLPELIMPEVVR